MPRSREEESKFKMILNWKRKRKKYQ